MSVQVRPGRAQPVLGARRIELRALSGFEWRVSDRTVPEGDAGSVLGFVERTEDRAYEVLQLKSGHGIALFTFGSLSEVVDHFALECA